MEKYKSIDSVFDFIDTLSFSGHKFLGAYSISGMLLTKRSYLRSVFHEEKTEIGFIQKAIDVTVAGSRQGFYVAELYLLINEAFKYEKNHHKLYSLWHQCLELSYWLATELKKTNNSEDIIHNQIRVVFPAPNSEEDTDTKFTK